MTPQLGDLPPRFPPAAGLAGAGFSFTENILYLGRTVTTFAAAGTSDVNAVAPLGAGLFLRVVMVPFFHPLMVAVFGLAGGRTAKITSFTVYRRTGWSDAEPPPPAERG